MRWGPRLFHYIGGSSLLFEDEVENLYVVLKTGGALSILQGRALFGLRRIRMKTGQEVKELSRLV